MKSLGRKNLHGTILLGCKDNTYRICKLKKNMLGLKQAPKCRNSKFIELMCKFNLKSNNYHILMQMMD